MGRSKSRLRLLVYRAKQREQTGKVKPPIPNDRAATWWQSFEKNSEIATATFGYPERRSQGKKIIAKHQISAVISKIKYRPQRMVVIPDRQTLTKCDFRLSTLNPFRFSCCSRTPSELECNPLLQPGWNDSGFNKWRQVATSWFVHSVAEGIVRLQ